MSFSGTIKRIAAAGAALGLAVLFSVTGVAAQISELPTWVPGTTNAKVAGSNRLMVVMVMGEHSAAFSATGVTYGGQAMTKQTQITSSATGTKNYAAIFTLQETGVNAATSGTIAVTWSPSPASSVVYSVLLSGVDQTTPVSATAQNSLATSGTTVSSSSLTAASGDMVIYTGATGGDYSMTPNNGFLEKFESGTGSSWGDGVGGYKMGTGIAETPSFSSSSSTRMVICAMVVKKYTSGTSYTLTMENDGHGTTNPTGSVSVAQGAATPINATNPASGYRFLNWTVTSGTAAIADVNSASTTVTLNSGNATIRANFALSFTLNMENDGHGTTNPTGAVSVVKGAATPITASAATGYSFVNWTVTSGAPDIANVNAASTTVTLNSGNATIKANFVIIPVAGWTMGDGVVTTTDKVGIGTTTPGTPLAVSSENIRQAVFGQDKVGGQAEIRVGVNNDGIFEHISLGYDAGSKLGYLQMVVANRTPQTIFNINTPDQVLETEYDLTANIGRFGSLTIGQGLTVNNNDVNISNGNLNIPNGKITVKTWSIEAPDYVFEPGYKLPSLKQVEEFVTINKHLPEVPSAKEMTAKGIDITEMNLRLLKKVEELTLYVIEQDKKIEALEKKQAKKN